MPYEYSAENHDWDLTLRASWNLLMLGQAIGQATDSERRKEQEFSSYTGSMVLAFSAIESFTTSVAFSMPKEVRFKGFDFEKYRKTSRFWNKLDYVCATCGLQIDKSQGLFQVIQEMQDWRNSLTHASPYEIEKTEIQDTLTAPGKLHKPFQKKEYPRQVNAGTAKQFYSTALQFVELIKDKSGLEPRASCSYTPI